MKNRAISVEAETANTEEIQVSNVIELRNAYQMNPQNEEYNSGTSARNLEQVKMYAELKLRYTTRQLKYFREDLYKHYRIREQRYAEMFDQQQGNCDCCGRNQAYFSRRLSVDHDHLTGEVRALLCDNCNPAIGFVLESIEMCELMIKYLKKFKK